MQIHITNKGAKLAFHTIGLSSVGALIFLQTIIFINIAQKGSFAFTAQNSSPLFIAAIGLIVTAFIYIGSLYNRIINNLT
jgi:hypothetical protein